MSDKADHLIERAAALLRSANAPQLPEHPGEIADQVPGPVPSPNGAAAPPPLMPPGIPPLRVGPARPPIQLGNPVPGADAPRRPLSTAPASTQTALTGSINSAATSHRRHPARPLRSRRSSAPG